MKKISWGVLSTANIGLTKVIPAMQKGQYSKIDGIASRGREKAEKAARDLGIPKIYGSYEELLEDSDIEAVYIPLPNHLHVEWILKSLEAGKHVLCEKPIGLSLEEAEQLLREVQKFPGLKVMEAFMYRFHPQWIEAKKLVEEGAVGELRTIRSMFSYYNDNPQNIRNMPDIGGGGLLDIGCYNISLSRFIFGSEPLRVCGSVEYDPVMKIDRLASGILEFDDGAATFTCSTQLADRRSVELYGTQGRIDFEEPFAPSTQGKTKIILHRGSDKREILFEACNQYTLQGDRFSEAILNGSDVPTPPGDAVANMKCIDGIFRSSKNRKWINL